MAWYGVVRYDVDGIHFDDYFYPYPSDGVEFPDDHTYDAYLEGGGTLAKDDWRRDNVNRMVQRVYSAIKDIRPSCVFSISPFGLYRPGHPDGMPSPITGLDPYTAQFADAKLWLSEGWVDYLAPLIYWAIDPPAQSYPVVLDWWLDNNPASRHIYAANGVYKMEDSNNWPVSEVTDQVEVTRDGARRDKFSLGNNFYSARFFRDNTKGINDVFRLDVYATPASTPLMAWMRMRPPVTPSGVHVDSSTISWKSRGAEDDVFRWMVYKLERQAWKLHMMLPARMTSSLVAPGTYALRSMNGARELSDEVVVHVMRSRGLA